MSAKYDLYKDGVTQSILGTWLKCKRLATLSVLQGWTSIKPKSTFIFGEITHAILEEVYTLPESRKSPPSIDRLSPIINKHVKLWKKEHEIDLDENLTESLEFNIAKIEAVLPEYFKYWHRKDFKDTKWLGLEKEFVFKINRIPVRGKRDGEYEQDNKIFLFETKTKSQIDERSLYEILPIDLQTNLYSLSLFQEYGKWPSGVRYNVIRNPQSKAHKNEPLNLYTERLRKEISRNSEHYFKRFFVYKTRKELEGFKKEFETILKDYENWYLRKSPDYKNPNACSSKYGTCGMVNICSMGNYKFHKKRTKLYSELSYNREA